MSNEKLPIPKRRFEGYKDSWIYETLDDLLYEYHDKEEKNQGLPHVSLTKDGILPKSERYDRDALVTTENKKYRITRYNDICYNPANLKFGVIARNDFGNAIFSPIYVTFQVVKDNPIFIGYLLTRKKFINQALKYQEGTVYERMAVKPDDLCTQKVWLPEQEKEQVKIANFLQKIDSLIALEDQKAQKLNAVKSGYLSTMFPLEGQRKPKLRFKGFTGAWEQRLFANITFLSGNKNRDNLPLESYSITNENGFIPQNEQFENGGTMREADKTMYYVVSPNSFAYNPARINVGSIGYQNLNKSVIVSSLYVVFKTTDDVDDRFLWHWFKSASFQKLIKQYQEGGVRLYFYYDKLCMCSIALPSAEEQHKIGKHLDMVDNFITLHQRKRK